MQPSGLLKTANCIKYNKLFSTFINLFFQSVFVYKNPIFSMLLYKITAILIKSSMVMQWIWADIFSIIEIYVL